MELAAAAQDQGIELHFMSKNRLQEYTQKSALPLPVYHTVRLEQPPRLLFRSSVVVGGVTFASPRVFPTRKAAEQDVARIALESIPREAESVDIVPLIHEDATFCKSILNEYAVKMNLQKPTYTTTQAVGILPVFISTSIFNGQTYSGDPARNKKEAEQRAARAVIQSILADSNTQARMCEIIRSKGKLYSALRRKDSSSGLLSERNLPSTSQTQNNPSSTIRGNEVLEDLTNNKLPENICSVGEQVVKVANTETSTPVANMVKEECSCDPSSGTDGNNSSQPTLPPGSSLTDSKTNLSDGSFAHDQINNGPKEVRSSSRSEDSSGVILSSGVKRSDTAKNGRDEFKKARITEQLPSLPTNPGSSITST